MQVCHLSWWFADFSELNAQVPLETLQAIGDEPADNEPSKTREPTAK